MTARPITTTTSLLAILGTVMLSGCWPHKTHPHLQPQSQSIIGSITVSGTTNEASTVLINGQADSDPAPLSFSRTIAITEPATGTSTYTMSIAATDGSSNTSTQVIDVTTTR